MDNTTVIISQLIDEELRSKFNLTFEMLSPSQLRVTSLDINKECVVTLNNSIFMVMGQLAFYHSLQNAVEFVASQIAELSTVN